MEFWKVQIEMFAKPNSAGENWHAVGCGVHVALISDRCEAWNILNLFPLEQIASNRSLAGVHLSIHLFNGKERLSKFRTTKLVVIDRLPLLVVTQNPLIAVDD